jgi:hypothetical protein
VTFRSRPWPTCGWGRDLDHLGDVGPGDQGAARVELPPDVLLVDGRDQPQLRGVRQLQSEGAEEVDGLVGARQQGIADRVAHAAAVGVGAGEVVVEAVPPLARAGVEVGRVGVLRPLGVEAGLRHHLARQGLGAPAPGDQVDDAARRAGAVERGPAAHDLDALDREGADGEGPRAGALAKVLVDRHAVQLERHRPPPTRVRQEPRFSLFWMFSPGTIASRLVSTLRFWRSLRLDLRLPRRWRPRAAAPGGASRTASR